MRSSNSNSNIRSGGRNENGKDESNKFCAVCNAAGRPDYNTHFVRADKFDRNSAITCPYLQSIQCRICGGKGHTASYCERRSSSSSVRLPPISRTAAPASSEPQHQHLRAPPRIVFETHDPQQRRQLPPLKFVPRVRNDEPLLRRGPAEASPVHSPEKPRRPRSNNPFSALESSSDSESDHYSPVAKQPPHRSPDSSPQSVGRYRGVSDVKAWPSLPPAAAAHKPTLARVVAKGGGQPVLPLQPPVIFKTKSNSNPKKNKLWGDTDSEDDEEFLKRGLE
jgi:hypothetical protein